MASIYPIVWLDAIHYKIRENGKVAGKAVYTILGVNLEGRKEVLGLYISEHEGANFWLQVLTDLSNRGVKWTMPVQNWSLTISQLAMFF